MWNQRIRKLQVRECISLCVDSTEALPMITDLKGWRNEGEVFSGYLVGGVDFCKITSRGVLHNITLV